MKRSVQRIILWKLVACVVILGITLFSGCKGEPPRLTIENARAEFSPAMRDEASVYLTIKNDGGKDTLMSVRTSIPGTSADIHETRGELMVISNALRIPAKNSLELGPMGSHIMLTHLPGEVKEGNNFTLTLVFKKSGEIQVPVVFMKMSRSP
ncbi:MAG: copper chaperone PCu(A)C [Betaproteobacteria bacterium]